jgi:hypothetical protein
MQGTKSRAGPAPQSGRETSGMSEAGGAASLRHRLPSTRLWRGWRFAPTGAWRSVPLLLVGAHLLPKIEEAWIRAKVVEIVVAVDVVTESESE